jgi:hypothetical protein
MAEAIVGATITLSTSRVIPTPLGRGAACEGGPWLDSELCRLGQGRPSGTLDGLENHIGSADPPSLRSLWKRSTKSALSDARWMPQAYQGGQQMSFRKTG